MNLTIGRLSDEAELPTIRAIFQEYADSMGLDLAFQNFAEEVADLPANTLRPSGCILLARVDGEPAGRRYAAPRQWRVRDEATVCPARVSGPQTGPQARGADDRRHETSGTNASAWTPSPRGWATRSLFIVR